MSSWRQDDGHQHYRVLGLSRAASQQDIKQAYRTLARKLHPDKGGNAATFATLQAAFETLSDPKSRAAYDSLAADLRFRPGAAAPYNSHPSPGGPPPPPPGATEAMLLQQLLQRGGAHPCAVFDPLHQLCVTCEVCRRPATQQCWTCGMDICEFCTRRQHWKGSVSLHWPLVDRPGSMVEQLGKRELELKRQADGQAYKEAQPDYRPQSELLVLRQFQEAIISMLQQQSTSQPDLQQKAATATTTTAIAATTTTSSSSRVNPTAAASSVLYPGRATVTDPAAGLSCSSPLLHTFHASLAMTANTPCQHSISTSPRAQKPSAFSLLPAGSLAGASAATAVASSISKGSKTGALVSRSNAGLLAVQHHHNAPVNKCWAAWQGAPEEVRRSLGRYDNRLGRFYMWAQTECCVVVAVHLPTGGGKVPPALTVEATTSTLLIQHKGFAPVLNRAWAHAIDATAGISSWTSSNGQLLVVSTAKAQPGRMWNSCFKGDPYMARNLQPPYRLVQLPSEVQLELQVPFWVQPAEDVHASIGVRDLTVVVDGVLRLQRVYWWDEAQAARLGISYQVVDSSRSSWCVLEQTQQENNPVAPPTRPHTTATASSCSRSQASLSSAPLSAAPRGPIRRVPKLLSITLALPDPTQEEVMYKKGVRQNNASATRSCPHGCGKPGVAFFLEDEDEWGLQAVLQAVLFQQTGRTFLTPKPWELAAGAGSLLGSNSPTRCNTLSTDSSGSSSSQLACSSSCAAAANTGYWVVSEAALPADVAQHLKWLRGDTAAAHGSAGGAEAAVLPLGGV